MRKKKGEQHFHDTGQDGWFLMVEVAMGGTRGGSDGK
jgi:hypothetical protein